MMDDLFGQRLRLPKKPMDFRHLMGKAASKGTDRPAATVLHCSGQIGPRRAEQQIALPVLKLDHLLRVEL
jgi:hypothetical protein